MLSSTSEYALRAIVLLASTDRGYLAASEIAARTGSPPAYTAKVLKDLSRAGRVTSRRGPNGGYSLSRPSDEITVLDVIDAVDPIKRIPPASLQTPAHQRQMRPLRERLNNAVMLLESTLSASTIGALLDEERAAMSSDQTEAADVEEE